MDCPSCRGAMTPIDYEGVPIRTCPACGGEFVGAGEIAHIVRVREERFGPDITDDISALKPTFGPVPGSLAKVLGCPACGDEMTPMNYASDSGICVDSCRSCGGMWLDSKELEKVQALMERWDDAAATRMAQISGEVRAARASAALASGGSFEGSRFAFVNALINRVLDAA
jgi:Zn-finger nucleic acid-binding protein